MVKVIRRSPPLIILLDVLFIFIFVLAATKIISIKLNDKERILNYHAQIIVRAEDGKEYIQTNSGWSTNIENTENSIVYKYDCRAANCEKLPSFPLKGEKYDARAVLDRCLSEQIQFLFSYLCTSRSTIKYCRPLSISVNSEGNIQFSDFEENKKISDSSRYKSVKKNIEAMQKSRCTP